jgi:hypothetical protein
MVVGAVLCYAKVYWQLQHVSISPSLWISQSVKNAMQIKNTAKYILYYNTFSFFLYIVIPATSPFGSRKGVLLGQVYGDRQHFCCHEHVPNRQ